MKYFSSLYSNIFYDFNYVFFIISIKYFFIISFKYFLTECIWCVDLSDAGQAEHPVLVEHIAVAGGDGAGASPLLAPGTHVGPGNTQDT